MKKYFAYLCILLSLCGLAGCGGQVTLSSDQINYFEINDGPQDLSALGEALADSKDLILSFSGLKIDDILDSFTTIGSPQTTNLTIELALAGKGDWKKLSNLRTIGGLNKLIVYGENDWTDLTPLNALPDLDILELKQQKIRDFSPLKGNHLTKLSLIEMADFDFATLLDLPVAEMEFTVADDMWVALDLLKENPHLSKINNVDVAQFKVTESLDDEAYYYYQQFDDVFTLTEMVRPAFEGTMTLSEEQPVLRRDAVMIAASYDALQTVPYQEQRLIKTACGFAETEESPRIFYPYIEMYAPDTETSRTLRYAAVPSVSDRYLSAVTLGKASIIICFYVIDPANNNQITANFTTTDCVGYVRILDQTKGLCYPATKIVESFPWQGEDQAAFQAIYTSALDTYLTDLAVEGVVP